MGQSPEQFMTIQRLVSAARVLGRERGWSHDRLLIGADCYSRFAVEVVSEKWTEDYDDAPDKYAQLGTRELVIFDAETSPKANPRRERLQVFRRDEVGALARVYAGPGPAWSEELQIWLVADQVDGSWGVALARDAEGVELVLTESELAESEAQRAETEKQRAEVMAAKLRALGIDPTKL
ncbi:MAG: Uma2 family endonuclease [Deltaproteobacteria bacterium]|nr:Uma2 family endonuclease [Deltaproteobacteria bacterium]